MFRACALNSGKCFGWLGVLCAALLLSLAGCGGSGGGSNSPQNSSRPNIVLIVMDDIGIDQWQIFGYGGNTPASTPNIGAIAQGGVRFHNMWAMPACSNGRASLFTGRYPFRTNVFTALGNQDLSNYMVNPNETSLPILLKKRGYTSALVGKYHMGIQENNPYGYGMVQSIGFDYFSGWLDETGDPSSIDTTAGGVAPIGTWSCGFVKDAAHGGADSGACYQGDGTCAIITKSGAEAPGRVCRDSGGIFDPAKTCTSPVPAYINFSTLSGHYVSPLVISSVNTSPVQVPSTDIRARTFRGEEAVDAAIVWVSQQPANQPWMLALTFATAHTPLMQPPAQLLPTSEPDSSNLDCTDTLAQRTINNEMEESLDNEVGRFMTSTGIASTGPGGQLIYHPRETNTWVIFVTDNGSTGTVVKTPFDINRAKSTAYQTGVWVPGIVAGPGVIKAGRSVDAMTNIVDLYGLIADLAGINARKNVPRIIDSEPMLPYLTNPDQPDIRKSSFTQIGTNQHANGQINGPCVYNTTTCTQIAPTKGVCEDNNGIWWGAGATDPSTAGIPPEGLAFCCDVAVWQHDHGQTVITDIYPLEAHAIRNKNFKIVVNNYNAYDDATNACKQETSNEFYQINEDVPTPKLDVAGSDLLATGMPPLNRVQQKNYDQLSAELSALLASQPTCTGDINLDGVVNELDIEQWNMFASLSMGASSWADVNQDGLTNDADLDIIQQNEGPCPN